VIRCGGNFLTLFLRGKEFFWFGLGGGALFMRARAREDEG
jgi:hypothetical protein